MNDLRWLERAVDSFIEKRADIEKKADPPFRGLNATNPLKRFVYKKYGYVPQAPMTYLSTPDQKRDYRDMVNEVDFFEKKQPWYNKENPTPEQRAARFDLDRATGNVGSSYTSRYVSMDLNRDFKEGPWVVLGSYPSSESGLRHEVGHYMDDLNSGDPEKFFMDTNRVDKETRAWDLAGIAAGNPLREACLDTYRLAKNPENFVEKDKPLHKTLSNLVDRVNEEERKVYRHPETYIDKYKTNGIPVVYDYNSALEASRNGYGIH
jgi:hypothetical protein